MLLLHDNSLQNAGEYFITGGDEANTGCPPEYKNSCGMFDEFALRDIKEGEELLCDYDEFIEQNLWDGFGL